MEKYSQGEDLKKIGFSNLTPSSPNRMDCIQCVMSPAVWFLACRLEPKRQEDDKNEYGPDESFSCFCLLLHVLL